MLGTVFAVFHCLALLFAAAFVFYQEAGISQHCQFCWSSLLLLDIVANWAAVPPLEAAHGHQIASTSSFSPVGTWLFAYLG